MYRLENLGLGRIAEDEELLKGFIAHAIKKGKTVAGYSGNPYINAWFGNVQIILHTREAGDGELEITTVDYHSSGNAVWTFRIREPDLNPDSYEETERRVMVSKPDGNGTAILDLVNADVLPGWGKDELVRAQVIAFPDFFDYYATEEEYEKDWSDGRLLFADGCVFPAEFLKNHDLKNRKEGVKGIPNDENDNIMVIRGTVKHILYGLFQPDENEEPMRFFLRVMIGTQFGELEIVHTPEQVPEGELENLKEGATIFGAFRIYGDAAIYEYENGFLRDEEHDLHLLKSVLEQSCGVERMRAVLTDRSAYLSEYSGCRTFSGPDEIINRFRYIRERNEGKRYYAYMATICGTDEGTDLPYGKGKRCVILAEEDPLAYQSISFIDTDDEGNILSLTISKGAGYHFTFDNPPQDN